MQFKNEICLWEPGSCLTSYFRNPFLENLLFYDRVSLICKKMYWGTLIYMYVVYLLVSTYTDLGSIGMAEFMGKTTVLPWKNHGTCFISRLFELCVMIYLLDRLIFCSCHTLSNYKRLILTWTNYDVVFGNTNDFVTWGHLVQIGMKSQTCGGLPNRDGQRDFEWPYPSVVKRGHGKPRPLSSMIFVGELELHWLRGLANHAWLPEGNINHIPHSIDILIPWYHPINNHKSLHLVQ